jgi:phage terminase small subunit
MAKGKRDRGRPGRKTGKVTERQRRFAKEFPVDLNATQAAIRAGCSERSAHVTASRWLKNAKVAELIDAELKARAARVEVKQDEVLRELLRVAKADLRQLFDERGALKPVGEWPDEVAAFVSSIEVEELFEGRGEDREHVGQVRKVKLWPKVQALELLGKHLKLWVDRLEHAGETTQVVRYEYPDDGRGPA